MRLRGTKTSVISTNGGLGDQLWDLGGARPSLDLNFAHSKDLTDATTGSNLVDFTRASSGTYVGSDGLIKTAVTNLLPRSEEFDQSPWVIRGTAAVVANDEIAPNGTVTADKVTFAGSTNDIYAGSLNVASGAKISFSVYIKKSTQTGTFKITSANGGAAGDWTVNLALLGSDWERLTPTHPAVTQNTAWTGTGNAFSGPLFYQQSGSSVTVYLWGAQLEQSSTVGEYVKTTSTINSAPRFDHDPTTGESLGLLVEESRTNFLTNSESFTSWTVNQLVQSTASVAAPDGSPTVQLFTEDNTTNVHRIFLAPTTGNLTQTHSVFVKNASGTRRVYLSSDDASGARQSLAFDLQTGTLASNSGGWTNPFITAYPNGWYRIGGTLTDNGGTTLFIVGLNDGAFSSYLGDGTSGLYIWGAQLEAGSGPPTSYIPTTSSTVTRAADVASITGSNFSSWYRQDEGTVFQTYSHIGAVGSNNGLFNMHDSSAPSNNRHTIRAGTYSVTTAGATEATASYSIPALGVLGRLAYAYKTNDIAIARPTDQVILSDTSATLPTGINKFEIGKVEGTSLQLNGTIRRLTYWPTRLGNDTLQTITQ